MQIFACPSPEPADSNALESRLPERRTPLTPESVKALVKLGCTVTTAPGIGQHAGCSDAALTDAGATLMPTDLGLAKADIVLSVGSPGATWIKAMRPGAILAGLIDPLNDTETVHACLRAKTTLMAMAFVPRTSRAQAADALSSQASIAGYKAVLMAADRCPKLLPMMMTAAGTLSPAKVFVIGAGVAGLQAIATAKRLGAVVEAFDVRSATKEQVQSLGARFVEIKLDANADAAGGYAKALTDEQRAQQTKLMAKHVIDADIVITTAAVFGGPPPMLIPNDVVEQMKPGAVLVDLGVSQAHNKGNCQATQVGQTTTTENGVTLIGTTNVPGLLPVHASQVYANNLVALAKEMVVDGQLALTFENDILDAVTITHAGQIRNQRVQDALATAPAPGSDGPGNAES